MAYTEHFGRPIYRVRFTRTDEGGIDLCCISADDRDQAIAFLNRMYRDRVKRVISATRERRNR